MLSIITTITALISWYGSSTIVSEGVNDGVKDIKGIKHSFDYIGFIKDRIKNKDFKGAGALLPLAVPLINLMYAPLLASEIRENMVDAKDYIKPIVFLEDLEKEKQMKKKISPKRIFVNKDHLEGKYTLDEVEKLNDTTNYRYKVGTIDNEYVAIIGNYNQEDNEDHKVNIVEFLFEDNIKEYKFHPENEKDDRVKNKLFTVYSLTHNEELEEVASDIKIRRIRKQKEALKRLKEEITAPRKTMKDKVMIKK